MTCVAESMVFLVGIGTVLSDDPLLTARPAGPRIATRIVLDTLLKTPLDSQLVKTAKQVPTILVHTADDEDRIAALIDKVVNV